MNYDTTFRTLAVAACMSAIAACGSSNKPGGGSNAAHHGQFLAFSECMRSHGVTDFPDPTFTPPSDPAGYSIVSDRNGVILAVPSTINPQSPVFQHASAVCGFH